MQIGSRRKWYQFSLRAAGVVTTLLCFVLAVTAYRQHKLRKQQEASNRLHGIIREATLATQSRVAGLTWEETESCFAAAGYSLVSSNNAQHATGHRYLMHPRAWRGAIGPPHDLVVNVMIAHPSASVPIHEVLSVEAGLVGNPNLSYRDVMELTLYPEGSAVSFCLAQPEVVEAAEKYPYVKKVEITYDLVRHHRSLEWHYGFHVIFELGKTAEKDTSGKRLNFTVTSFLDPPQDRDGRSLQSQFSPSEALGPVFCWGGSEWVHSQSVQ